MDAVIETVELTQLELTELRRAKWTLEHPTMAIRLTNILGAPIEKGFNMLPQGWTRVLYSSVHSALSRAIKVATFSLRRETTTPSSDRFHRFFVGTTGAIGGAFGLVSLPIELPISTTAMLRSIADIARSEGHNLSEVETQLACLEVFALGGRPSKNAKEKENRYWVVRAGLAKAISEATTYIANRGIVSETAPAVVRLVAAIAARFGVIVSEQIAAKAFPVVGAATGSAINLIFMNHFQRMAKGHFTIKRLEKKYGSEQIEAVYRSVAVPISRKENQGRPAQNI
jgi:hypothetical protein